MDIYVASDLIIGNTAAVDMEHSISPPKTLLYILLVLEWHASHMVMLCVAFWAATRLFS